MAAANSGKAAKPKGKPRGRPFVKGAPSANPHGVPAWYREMRALAGQHTPKAIKTLVDLMANAKDEVRVRAAEALLDRAGLKPYATEPDKLDVTTHDAGDAIGVLSALVARRLAAAGAGSSAAQPQPAAG